MGAFEHGVSVCIEQCSCIHVHEHVQEQNATQSRRAATVQYCYNIPQGNTNPRSQAVSTGGRECSHSAHALKPHTHVNVLQSPHLWALSAHSNTPARHRAPHGVGVGHGAAARGLGHSQGVQRHGHGCCVCLSVQARERDLRGRGGRVRVRGRGHTMMMVGRH